MSLCSQLSDQDIFNYFATQTTSNCCSDTQTYQTSEKKAIACGGCLEKCPCPFFGNLCNNTTQASASPGHCENGETTDPTEPGESPGSGFDINYGTCINGKCSTAQYDPCGDNCASIKDPCYNQYGTALGLTSFPRRKMIGSCACADPGDAAGHYNCANSGFPGQTPSPLTTPTDNPSVDDIRLVKVFINNEEICIPILCDVGCDDF